MPIVTDPVSGLQFVELSHPWGHGLPTYPGYDDVQIERFTSHAKQGVLTQRLTMTMHHGTHVDAPLHLVPRGQGIGEVELDRFFGLGKVAGIPKGEWETISVADLIEALPAVSPGEIVVINTGWHRRFADSQEYFAHAPGLSPDAARWLVERQVKLVALDTPAVDHPLRTSLAEHRNGPQLRHLAAEYLARTGKDPAREFAEWNVAHRTLLAAGIPTVLNVGGDVEEITGQSAAFQCFPWDWRSGDACGVRFVAIFDPGGKYRLEPGITTGASA